MDDQKEFLTRRSAQKSDYNDFLPEESFSYSAFIEYDQQKEENSVIFLSGRGVCPSIKLSQTELDFYECPMNEKRDILVNIENHNEEVPLDYRFQKLPFFFINPQEATLLPNQSSTFTVSFLPKSLGDFSNTLELSFLNGSYTILLNLHATSGSISRKTLKTRGPEGLVTDFDESKNFIIEGTRSIKTRKENRLIFSSHESLKPKDFLLDSFKTDLFLKTFTNRQKYDQFIKDSRITRLRTKENGLLAKKAGIIDLQAVNDNSSLIEDGKPTLPPIDKTRLFDIGLYNKEKLPKLTNPSKNDTLFVKKPIDKYEPIVVI